MKKNVLKVRIISVMLAAALMAGSAFSVWADGPGETGSMEDPVEGSGIVSESSEPAETDSSSESIVPAETGSSSESIVPAETGSSSENSESEESYDSSENGDPAEADGSSVSVPDGSADETEDGTEGESAVSEEAVPSVDSTSDDTWISEGTEGKGDPGETIPEISLAFNAAYTRFDLVFKGYEAAEGEILRAAIWSEEGGQDDLEWAVLTKQADGTYKKTVMISDFAHPGVFDIHVYKFSADGTSAFVAGKSENIPTITVGNLKLTSEMLNGTAEITSEAVSCPSGIKSARAAAWSKADQSDLYWYDMHEDTSGNWTFTIDLKNHNNNAGKYNVHMYAVDGNGFTRYSAGSTFDFSGLTGELKVTVDPANGQYTALVDGFSSAAPYKEIRVATWTDAGGQDDLKWHTLTVSGDKASVTPSVSDLKHYGTAYAHAYIYMANGEAIFLDGCEYTLKAPSSDKLKAETNAANGSFVLTLPGLQSDFPVKEVKMAVWSASDQSNLYWYTAEKSGTDYVVNGSLLNHKSMSGNYTVHVYVYPENAPAVCVSGASMEFSAAQGEISFKDNGAGIAGNEEKTYRLSISNAVSKNGITQLQFAVWNADNTGTIRWYTASHASDGSYYADVPISDFKTLGQYVTHVYVTDNFGNKSYLDGKIIMNVTGTVTGAAISTGNDNTGKGTFDVVVSGASAPSGIESMTFYVWTAADQSDMHTYTAALQSDGSYKTTVDIANHGFNSGTFYIHTYAVMGNGIRLYVIGMNRTFTPDSIMFVTKPDDGLRYVGITVPAATPVKFAVWSEKNGLDDLIWYDSSATVSKAETTVQLINHDGSGIYNVHAYSGDMFLGGTTFEVSEEEARTGWVYEGGYKFYYKNGARLTDLRSIVGGPYMIFINRITNTMNIFSYDYATGQYIIPVVCFACSCGIPGGYDTVAGYFTLGAKYRWKELMGPSYGQYVCHIVEDYYIHSVAGYNMTSFNLNPYDYNMLGNNASHGCVRLNVANAKWVYENVPSGSPIYIYDSYDPGPYGKPGTIKIPATQNWDPTDPAITG